MNLANLHSTRRATSRKLMGIAIVFIITLVTGCSLFSQSPELDGTALQDGPGIKRVTPGRSETPGEVIAVPEGAVSEPVPVYFEVVQAYEENRLDDARTLALVQLVTLSDDLALANNDSEREAQSGRALGLIMAVAEAETQLKASDRLGGDVSFFNSMKDVIAQVKNVTENVSQAPAPVKDFLRGQTGRAASGLIRTGEALVPMSELEQIYADFQSEIQGVGFAGVYDVLEPQPVVAANEESPVTVADVAQMRAIAQDYFTALVSGDTALLQSVTGVDATTAQSMLDALQQDFEEEGVSGVNSITVPVSANVEVFLNDNGLFTAYVQGILVEVVMPDNSVASTTIDKRFTMEKEADGTWRIEAPQQ